MDNGASGGFGDVVGDVKGITGVGEGKVIGSMPSVGEVRTGPSSERKLGLIKDNMTREIYLSSGRIKAL